jgi:hypothetical protein
MDKEREQQWVYNGSSSRGFVVRFSEVSKRLFFLQNYIFVLELTGLISNRQKMVARSPATKRPFQTADQQARPTPRLRMI